MHSNRYTLLYAVGVTMAVAVVLALASSGLQSLQDANVARARRIAILQTVMTPDLETLASDYATYITERVFDSDGNDRPDIQAFDLDIIRESRKADDERSYPLYIFENQRETHYIIPIQGSGLWGPISAYLALGPDLNTISGVTFDHDKETPGLGAEITTADFQDRFVGKQLFGAGGEFQSVSVVKNAGDDIESQAHQVDGLTGATMTMNGVGRMLEEELMLYQRIIQEVGP